MFRLLATLVLVAPFALSPAAATQTCDPLVVAVCTGDTASTDNGEHEFGGCDGHWVDAWIVARAYAQVCVEHGTNTPHLWICPLGEWIDSPNCQHVTA